MCRRHYRGIYGSQACYRRRGYRYPNGRHYRHCIPETTIVQSNLMLTTITRAIVPVPIRSSVRESLYSAPYDELLVSSDPPPYNELRTTDHIDLPGSARRYSQSYSEKFVPLDSLGKNPGYIMVNPSYLPR
jgi:hypothetical protein